MTSTSGIISAILRPGTCLLAGAVAGAAVHLWLASSVLVPVSQSPVTYVFISANLATFATFAAAVAATMAIVHVAVRRFSRQSEKIELLSVADVAYAAPLLLLGVSALELLALLPRRIDFLSVLTYLIVDLRWWWTAAVLVWTLVRLDERLGGAIGRGARRVASASPRWTPEAALVAISSTWVVAGTPALRFTTALVGDEPKYIRYCENLYQGHGFEISRIQPIAELGDDYRPPIWRNLSLIGATLPQEFRDLVDDAASAIRGRPRNARPAARGSVGDFIVSKNGGLFQLHNPGFSLIMFPAYYVDRRLAEVRPGSDAQWPDAMPTVNTLLLALYVASAVLLFRIVRRYSGLPLWSWLLALAVMLTLPVAAFPFQVYPELAAGFLLLIAARAVLFPRETWVRRWFVVGLVIGYLPWVHVRFSGVAAILFAGTVALLYRQRRKTAWLAVGFAVPIGCLVLYSYQITGSLNPMSGYFVEGSHDPLSVTGALRGGLGYLVDRDWGLFAHSPVYLLALPGAYWLIQRRQYSALLIQVAMIALILTAGAHSLVGAGTTPMRLICAVVPFAALPMAEAVLHYRHRRAFQVTFAALLVLSLHTALAYNLHDSNKIRMLDASTSGWKANLLFPIDSRWPWVVSSANAVDMALWLLVILALLAAPAAIERARLRQRSLPVLIGRTTSGPAAALTAAALIVVTGTIVAGATQVWSLERYQIGRDKAAEQAALFVDDLGHCSICAISGAGRTDTRTTIRYLENVDPSVALRQHPGAAPAYGEWLQMPGRIRAWYNEANGHDPAETDVGHYLYQWREEHVPAVEIRRRIFSAAGKPEPGK